jgi:hypothetical protein
VDNSSHASLQRPSAERQISPVRFDKASHRRRRACCRRLRYLGFSNAFHVIFASISAMHPQGEGG